MNRCLFLEEVGGEGRSSRKKIEGFLSRGKMALETSPGEVFCFVEDVNVVVAVVAEASGEAAAAD